MQIKPLTRDEVVLPLVLFGLLANMMPDNPYVRLVQRLFETLIYDWLLYVLFHIRNHRQQSKSSH
jgi:hypothetical protein